MHPAAAQSAFVAKAEPLGRYLLFSLAAHAGLGAALLLANLFLSRPAIDLDPKPIHASLVRKGTPRDQKLLPRKEEAPPPPKEVQGSVAPVTKPSEPAPTGRNSLLDALNKAQRKPGEKEGDAKRQLFGAFNKVSKTAQDLEGDPNGDPNGDSATQEGERYWGILSAQVRRYYDVSQTIPDSERIHLRAVVEVRIGKSGEVAKVNLAKSSQNALFDQAVIAAVKKASPFPPPPDNLRDQLQRGVKMEFTP